MYIRENRDVNPVDSTVDASILQSTPICEARSASSPALYGLKKSAGRDMMRIIDAASTDMLSFVSIRAWIISFTAVTSSTLTDTHTEKTAMATSSRTLPEGSTGPVLRCYYEINPFYVDNLDAEVVAEFIRVTHEFYYRTIPEELLKHLKGIFSDEPQLSRKGLLWSFTLEEAYWQAYHRELLPELPSFCCPPL